MSNYPPGVSGNEYAISGPDKEWEAEQPRDCPECGAPKTVPRAGGILGGGVAHPRVPRIVFFQAHHDEGAWWFCDECETAVDLPDPRDPFEQAGYGRGD